MATHRKKRKLAADNKDNQDDHLRKNQARSTNISRNKEDYITQMSEENASRVTKKLSLEFSGTTFAFWAHWPNETKFLWTRKRGFTPDPLPRHPWIQTKRTKKQTRIVQWRIYTMNWVSLWANLLKISDSSQRRLLTIAVSHVTAWYCKSLWRN